MYQYKLMFKYKSKHYALMDSKLRIINFSHDRHSLGEGYTGALSLFYFITLQTEADVKMLKRDEAEWLLHICYFSIQFSELKISLKFKENVFVNLIKEAHLNPLEHKGL